MAPLQRSSPRAGPFYCPRCRLESRNEPSGRLCPECGESLVSQGFCPVCEAHWLLGIGALCPKHDIALEAAPVATSDSRAAGQPVSWVTITVFPNSLAAAV